MLKLANNTSLRSVISLQLRLTYAFGNRNKRDHVPKIMKDAKFTREGIKPAKHKSYQYDLTQPHIQFPERYYDEKVDRPLARKVQRQRTKENKGFDEVVPGTARPLERIIEDLTDNDVQLRGSKRILVNINELETHYPEQIDNDIREIIIKGLKSMCGRLHITSLREIGITATLCRKYGLVDKETWNSFKLALLRFFRREEHDNFHLLGSERNEYNFVVLVNNILHLSSKNNLYVTDLVEDIEKNYIDKIDQFTNTHNLVLFTTTLASIPSQKKAPIWGKLDAKLSKNVDKMNVLDAISLIGAYSKAQVTPSFLDQLVEKFVTDFDKVNDRRVEKICIVAQALANLKKNYEKFSILAERELEKNIESLNKPIDCRYAICSFHKLGINSKKIYSQSAQVIIQNQDSLSLREISQFTNTFLPKNLLPPQFFEAIAQRASQIIEEDPASLTTKLTADLLKGFEKWSNLKLLNNDELVQKIRDYTQY